MAYSKPTLLAFLQSNDLEAVASAANKDVKVLSQLVRIAYDKETLVGWRAIRAIGLASRSLVRTDHAFLRETIRKLLWSLTDESGGIGWSAPEILGEIVSADPEQFSDIIPLISEVYDIEEKVFRPGVIYALSRIADVRPDRVILQKDIAFRGLDDTNPLVRVYAIQLSMLLKALLPEQDRQAFERKIKNLKSDKTEVWVYGERDFYNIQIKEAAEKW